jgi:hypothetical protein
MQSRANVAVAFGVVLLVAGCGYDNPGEPRTPAEELSAPNLGDVHVYCVEREAVLVTPCSVTLAADTGHSRTELRTWWLRAAKALHKAGTFSYKDDAWRFDAVFIDGAEHRADGNSVTYGWSCPGDDGHTEGYVWRLMRDRNPGAVHEIPTRAAAQERGCTFALYPDLSD